MKLYQVKMDIVNCADVQMKVLKVLTAKRRDYGIDDNYVTQLNIFKWTRPVKCYYHKVKRNTELNTCGILASSKIPITNNSGDSRTQSPEMSYKYATPTYTKYLDLFSC